jgi:hypothetical protein
VDATASQFAYCEFTAPVPGTWYLSVRRFSGQGDYQATVSIFGPDCSNPLNAGKPCADRNPCTQSETCQSGTCVGTPVADGTSCDDGNPCTRPDTCQAGTCVNDSTPLSTCRSSDKALLLLNDKGANNDKLVWKWLKGQATSMADFGDPTSSTDYTLCLYAGYAGTAAALVADAAIPASSTHWSSLGDKGYRYNDPTRSAAGIQTALLRGSDKDAAKIVLKGKGAGLPHPTLSLALPVKIQLVRTDNDGCWQSDFDVGDVLRNDSEQFKAKVK